MQKNKKRVDAKDIQIIIDKLVAKKELVTEKSIAGLFGQTPANIHRIVKMFAIDLKPYQASHRAQVKIDKLISIRHEQVSILTQLKNIDTSKYTLSELLNMVDFQGTDKQLKTILVNQQLTYKTKSWFAQHLKKVDTQDKSLRTLFEECKLNEQDVSFATFRTRLYENAIPYKQVIVGKNWWQNLKQVDKQVPQDAIDELHAYFKINNVISADYTLKELYGYFDFDMPYLAFKHLIVSQEIKTKLININ